jgi:iron complex outermembrane receptor protein
MKLLLATTALALSLTAPAEAQTGGGGAGPGTTGAPGQSGQVDDTRTSAGTGQRDAVEQTGGIQDVIVTAQRREERSQDVPIAISAFSAAQLQATGVSSTLELGQVVPNLISQNNTGLGSANAYYLRGLGNTETIATFDPPVGTYIDDVYISRQNANNFSLFDVERIEVLRGPQGTLFGRNTTGGAINVIMAQPGDDIGGFAEIGYGRFNRRLARGSVDLPLADTFAIKVSGYWQNDDGYVRNTTTGERLNDADSWGARLGLKGELSPNVRYFASYTHINDESENVLNFLCDPNNPNNCDGRFAATSLRERPTSPPFVGFTRIGGPSPYTLSGRKANYALGNEAVTDLVTSRLEFDFAGQTLSFITGFLSQTQNYAIDFFDGRTGGPSLANPNPAPLANPRGTFSIVQDGSNSQFSQEVKLNGSLGQGLVDYVAGVFYIREENRTDFADVFAASAAANLVLGDRTMKNTTEAIAGYAQADVNIGALKLTAGVRYTDEVKTLSFFDQRPECQIANPAITCLFDRNFVVPANGSTIPTAAAIPLRQQAKVWTPRFAINYKPGQDFLLYASATRGFKSGGWNARGYTPQGVLPFAPEKVWSYEAGLKSELLNRRVRANITLYQLDVTDLQTPSGIVNPVNGSISFVTRNFADYRNRGVEAEITVVPVDGLNLFVNASYSDDKYILQSNQPQFDQYGIISVAGQQAACRQALAANKIPGGPNVPATQPSIVNCAAGIVDANGNIATPVRTPDWIVAVGGSYRAPLGGGFHLTPSVAANWRSDQQVATANFSVYSGAITGANGTFNFNPFSGNQVIGSFSEGGWLVNAGLALNFPDDRFQLAVTCTNCFDEALIQSALVNTTYYNPPAMWQVRLRAAF